MSYVLQHWWSGGTWGGRPPGAALGAWAALAVWAAVAAAHLTRLRRDGQPTRSLAPRAAAFQGGLLLALLALISPLGYWAGTYMWVRSIQDLLLALVAPALIAAGAASLVLAPPAERDQPPAGTRRWSAWPVAAVLTFNLVWLGWHLPAPYDLAARNTAARYLEYACYLGAGMLFWLQLTGSRPSGPRLPPMRRLVLLIATAAADTILGMVLVFGSSVVYPAYRVTGHHVLSVLSDQQAAGAVLWMGVLPPLAVAAVALLNGWLDAEESDELSRDLDRVMGRAPALPAAPGSGKAVWHDRSGYRRPTIR